MTYTYTAAQPYTVDVRDAREHAVKKLACKMVRVLCELMKTFNDVPEERFLTIRLTYNDDTPAEYEPPHFRSCTNEAKPTYGSEPFTMKVGEVCTPAHSVTLKVNTCLDACSNEDDEEQEADEEMSVHSDVSHAQSSDHSDCDSEVSKDDHSDCHSEVSKDDRRCQKDESCETKVCAPAIGSAAPPSKPAHSAKESAAASPKPVGSGMAESAAAPPSKPAHSTIESATAKLKLAHSESQVCGHVSLRYPM